MNIHGDCIEEMAKMEPNSVDAIVTDPPYFQPVFHYAGTRKGGPPQKNLSDLSILENFFAIFMRECSRVIKETGTYYIFCDGQSYPIFYRAMFPFCRHIRPLIWDKIVSYNGYTWRHQHELIAWGEQEKTPRIATGDGDIIRCRGVLQKERLHPAQKPVELLIKLITKSTPPNGLILDPFMGSGTTGMAAKAEGFRFIGIDNNAEYVEIAKKRINAVVYEPKLIPGVEATL